MHQRVNFALAQASKAAYLEIDQTDAPCLRSHNWPTGAPILKTLKWFASPEDELSKLEEIMCTSQCPRLESLELSHCVFSWKTGYTFSVLRELHISHPNDSIALVPDVNLALQALQGIPALVSLSVVVYDEQAIRRDSHEILREITVNVSVELPRLESLDLVLSVDLLVAFLSNISHPSACLSVSCYPPTPPWARAVARCFSAYSVAMAQQGHALNALNFSAIGDEYWSIKLCDIAPGHEDVMLLVQVAISADLYRVPNGVCHTFCSEFPFSGVETVVSDSEYDMKLLASHLVNCTTLCANEWNVCLAYDERSFLNSRSFVDEGGARRLPALSKIILLFTSYDALARHPAMGEPCFDAFLSAMEDVCGSITHLDIIDGEEDKSRELDKLCPFVQYYERRTRSPDVAPLNTNGVPLIRALLQ